MTANGRQTSDYAINDYGATINTPGRVLRITERMQELVSSGKKVILSDLADLQQDVIDVIARRMVKVLLSVVES